MGARAWFRATMKVAAEAARGCSTLHNFPPDDQEGEGGSEDLEESDSEGTRRPSGNRKTTCERRGTGLNFTFSLFPEECRSQERW